MKLLAISDLHIGHEANREALLGLGQHPDDWLILAGDVTETEDELDFALSIVVSRFARVLWVPGNHELWTTSRDGARGMAKYAAMVAVCRRHGVDTPEDPPVLWTGPGGTHRIVLLFLLYDYSFRPATVALADAVRWAGEEGAVCADEVYLHPDPYPSREAWSGARCAMAERQLDALPRDVPLILVNHFPLRAELAVLPMHRRFSLWCGTRRTEQWHTRFGVRVVVTGHLHMPSTQWIDGVRFEEVSFGYPRQRPRHLVRLEDCLREILPRQLASHERWISGAVPRMDMTEIG
jgi:predicted phosphodiesterase